LKRIKCWRVLITGMYRLPEDDAVAPQHVAVYKEIYRYVCYMFR
jgi:hypothetical protein